MQYLSFLLHGSSTVCFSPSSSLVLNEKQECFCTDIELTYIVKLPFCVIILLRRRERLQYTRSFPERHLVDACVVRMSIFLSFNEDAALTR